MKTEEQLRKDVSATIKLLLLEFEELASSVEARHPVRFDASRQLIIRSIWQLYKNVLNAKAE